MRRKRYQVRVQQQEDDQAKYMIPPSDDSSAFEKAKFWKQRAKFARAAQLAFQPSTSYQAMDFNDRLIARFYDENEAQEIQLQSVPLQEKIRTSLFDLNLQRKRLDRVGEYYTNILNRKLVVQLLILKRLRSQLLQYE